MALTMACLVMGPQAVSAVLLLPLRPPSTSTARRPSEPTGGVALLSGAAPIAPLHAAECENPGDSGWAVRMGDSGRWRIMSELGTWNVRGAGVDTGGSAVANGWVGDGPGGPMRPHWRLIGSMLPRPPTPKPLMEVGARVL